MPHAFEPSQQRWMDYLEWLGPLFMESSINQQASLDLFTE